MDSSDKFENYSNFNNEKRIQLIKAYNKNASFTENTTDDLLGQFEKFITSKSQKDFSNLSIDDSLIDTIIKYSLLYLEEYNYDLKLRGISLIEHLVTQATSSQFNFNMRSKLIHNSLERYIIDKENCEFMNGAIKLMLRVLNVIEHKAASSGHSFRMHSIVIEALLNNCYMSTDPFVKLVYYDNYIGYLRQIGAYSCRHLERLLTVAFDSVDSTQHSLDLDHQEQILVKCLNLIECIIDVCALRIQSHAKRIINFLIRLLYLSCYSIESNDSVKNLEDLDFIQRLLKLFKTLFENNLVRKRCYAEFMDLQNDPNLSKTFLKLIENV